MTARKTTKVKAGARPTVRIRKPGNGVKDLKPLTEPSSEEIRERYGAVMQTAPSGIIIADSDKNIISWNTGARLLFGYTDAEIRGKPLDTLVPEQRRRGHFEGFEDTPTTRYNPAEKTVERIGVKKDGTKFPLEISISINETKKGTLYVGVVRDILLRKQVEEKLRESVAKLEMILNGTITALSGTVKVRDGYTAAHQHRVSKLASMIAEDMDFPTDTVAGIRVAGEIHDLGKIAIPSDILTKSDKLTEAEFQIIKSHPQVGYDLLKKIDFPWPVALIVLEHHERINGSGYPGGLSGKDILPEARIMAIADVVEAMGFHRPYRPSLGQQAALDEIEKNAGILYDYDFVRSCLHLFYDKNITLDRLDALN
jgi:PAS domain S-box-containing protein